MNDCICGKWSVRGLCELPFPHTCSRSMTELYTQRCCLQFQKVFNVCEGQPVAIPTTRRAIEHPPLNKRAHVAIYTCTLDMHCTCPKIEKMCLFTHPNPNPTWHPASREKHRHRLEPMLNVEYDDSIGHTCNVCTCR
jgi:hypothetical protein